MRKARGLTKEKTNEENIKCSQGGYMDKVHDRKRRKNERMTKDTNRSEREEK
jgi:hypothetical protein